MPDLFFFLFTTCMVFHWITFTTWQQTDIKTFHVIAALYTFRHWYMWYFSIEGIVQVLDFKIVSEMHSRNPWVSHPVPLSFGFLSYPVQPSGQLWEWTISWFWEFYDSLNICELAVSAVYCYYRGLPQV